MNTEINYYFHRCSVHRDIDKVFITNVTGQAEYDVHKNLGELCELYSKEVLWI